MEREQIITLIVEDMKHNQLLNSLHSIGLDDNDRYTLKLDILVAQLMGFQRGTIPDEWFDTYHQAMQNITSQCSGEDLYQQAVILFTTLQQIQQ